MNILLSRFLTSISSTMRTHLCFGFHLIILFLADTLAVLYLHYTDYACLWSVISVSDHLEFEMTEQFYFLRCKDRPHDWLHDWTHDQHYYRPHDQLTNLITNLMTDFTKKHLTDPSTKRTSSLTLLHSNDSPVSQRPEYFIVTPPLYFGACYYRCAELKLLSIFESNAMTRWCRAAAADAAVMRKVNRICVFPTAQRSEHEAGIQI